MSSAFTPLSGCYRDALAMQTALINSVLRLFKSTVDGVPFNPSPSTTRAEYEAAEADYDDYVSITMAAWNDPILAAGSGYQIISPISQFEVGTVDPVVGNMIGGCWVEDAATHVRQAVIFTQPIPMQLAGQGIPITLTEFFPTGV